MNDKAVSQTASQKPCIACRELIQGEATVCSHCGANQLPVQPDRLGSVSTWLGLSGAAIGLFASLWAGVHWLEERHGQTQAARGAIAIAQSQTALGDDEAAFRTLQAAHAAEPSSDKLASSELDAAMLRVENFTAYYDADAKATGPSLTELNELMKIFQSALPDSSGARKADVLAHIGWTRWEIAEYSESHADGESVLRMALAIDPSNVYANAMLGFYLRSARKDLEGAERCFATALATGRARPFVRRIQWRSLLRTDGIELPGGRAMVAQLANEMRQNGELLSAQQRHTILTFAYNPFASGEISTVEKDLASSLSGLPEAEGWATYQWLCQGIEPNVLVRDFMHANLLEASGKKPAALLEFKSLQRRVAEEQKTSDVSWLPEEIADAIRRLS